MKSKRGREEEEKNKTKNHPTKETVYTAASVTFLQHDVFPYWISDFKGGLSD